MLNIPESIPPPESDPSDSGIPLSPHLHKCTEFRNHNLHWLVSEWSVLAIDRIPLRNSRNYKDQELEGIPTDSRNSRITTYIGLFTNDQSWLSIEFRYGIPGIVRTRNRSGIGRKSRNWKEFPPIPGIPESQLTLACLRIISLGYQLNSATKFPQL